MCKDTGDSSWLGALKPRMLRHGRLMAAKDAVKAALANLALASLLHFALRKLRSFGGVRGVRVPGSQGPRVPGLGHEPDVQSLAKRGPGALRSCSPLSSLLSSLPRSFPEQGGLQASGSDLPDRALA